eukprot:scaffold227327_cov44-Prasinocladus_malaysianus.AAC.2
MADTLPINKMKMPVITAMLYMQIAKKRCNSLNPKGKEAEKAKKHKVDDHFVAKARHFVRLSDLIYNQDPEEAGLAV